MEGCCPDPPHIIRTFSVPSLSPPMRTPASPSHSITSEFSYFSAQHSSTSTTSISTYSPTSPSPTVPTSPQSPYPVITATVTSRNPGGSTNTTASSIVNSAHQNEMLQQFAMHVPNPPTLRLSSLRYPEVQSNSCDPNYRPTTASGNENLPSPMDRGRRMPPSSQSPLMSINSTLYTHTLSVRLPASIQPEMVTISANKGDKIKVVADAWHMENESHYEWQISFPPRDIDMSAVHAKFDSEKTLTIDVRRTPRLYRP